MEFGVCRCCYERYGLGQARKLRRKFMGVMVQRRGRKAGRREWSQVFTDCRVCGQYRRCREVWGWGWMCWRCRSWKWVNENEASAMWMRRWSERHPPQGEE